MVISKKIRRFTKKLKNNMSKAIEFAKKNTKMNLKGQVVLSHDEELKNNIYRLGDCT